MIWINCVKIVRSRCCAEGRHIMRETKEEKELRLANNKMCLEMSYEGKVILAKARVKEWARICRRDGKTYAVSVGGLDSITLLAFVRDVLGEEVPGVSVSIREDKSIQAMHKEMGVIPVPPLKTKSAILQEYGFPVISKLTAAKIERLQTPNDDSPIIRAYMTGDLGAWGHYGHNDKFKIPDKWISKFGGLYADMRPDLDCKVAPFKVSDKCCYWLKELPLKKYNEEHDIYPFWGIMQSEGGRRQYSLRMHGCNYVGKTTARSAPFNYFNRQDLLQLALDLHVHVPEIYGEIKPDLNGDLQTTKAHSHLKCTTVTLFCKQILQSYLIGLTF